MSANRLSDTQVLARALELCNDKQADVAAATRTAPSSVSRWLTRRSRPEVEAALRLAKLTQLPRADVLRAFGYDPDELGIHNDADPARETEIAWLRGLLPKLRGLLEPPVSAPESSAVSASKPTRTRGDPHTKGRLARGQQALIAFFFPSAHVLTTQVSNL